MKVYDCYDVEQIYVHQTADHQTSLQYKNVRRKSVFLHLCCHWLILLDRW